jgi:hypothetical protein
MDRRPQRNSLDSELRNLERELAALRVHVASIRNHINTTTTATTPAEQTPTTGDRVRFLITGQGYADGVIIRVTSNRVIIRQNGSGNIYTRAPHNVTII